MACDAPIRECLQWHYLPHLPLGKIRNRGRSIQAPCPVHHGGAESLTISAGEYLWTVWICRAGCDGTKVRRALIAAGVPHKCVPGGDGTETSQGEMIDAILADTSSSIPARLLRVHAVRRGYAHWPKAGSWWTWRGRLGWGGPWPTTWHVLACCSLPT
jgi:hypothetical protein